VDVIDLGRVEVLVDCQKSFGQCGGETDILDIFKQVHIYSPYLRAMQSGRTVSDTGSS
jgi:hypothetical protein